MVYVYGTFLKGDIDMAKFKMGDRVMIVMTDVSDPYSVGDTGKVKEEFDHIYNLYTILFDSGKVDWATESQLELISEDNKNWWETPEGIEWLSTQQDVEEQFLKSQEKKEDKTYRVGQRFWVAPSKGGRGWFCLLAQVGVDVVCLIDLESGNRIYEPVSVFNSQRITEDEMKMIARDYAFELL